MSESQTELQKKVESFLWQHTPDNNRLKLVAFKILRLIYGSVVGLADGRLSLRAMSLVYTTLLSIVPLLALSFSVLKAMGAHNEIEPFLFQFLAPLGEQGADIGRNIIQFIDNIKVGVLGSLGLGLLIYTVLSLVQKIENAFNMIWQVESSRSLGERFSNYLSVILIGPVIMVSAVGVSATVLNSSVISYFMMIEPFGSLIVFATKLLPYLMVIGVFTFIYVFVPNTRVNLKAALIGAAVSGVLWQKSGVLFATFVVNSSKYTAIYSSFAIVIMLLIWLYISWLILLFGSNVAFYVQNPSSLKLNRSRFGVSSRVKEHLALLMMVSIGRRHYEGAVPPTLHELADEVQVPDVDAQEIIDQLIMGQMLVKTTVGYLPAKSLDRLLLIDIIKVVRSAGEAGFITVSSLRSDAACSSLISSIEHAVDSALNNKSLHDLVSGHK